MNQIHRYKAAWGKIPISVYKRNKGLRSSHKESRSVYVIGKIIPEALDYIFLFFSFFMQYY